jgi:superfamily II DNA helicase RecQ
MSDLAAAQSELQTIFGFAEFRPGQAEIVSANRTTEKPL